MNYNNEPVIEIMTSVVQEDSRAHSSEDLNANMKESNEATTKDVNMEDEISEQNLEKSDIKEENLNTSENGEKPSLKRRASNSGLSKDETTETAVKRVRTGSKDSSQSVASSVIASEVDERAANESQGVDERSARSRRKRSIPVRVTQEKTDKPEVVPAIPMHEDSRDSMSATEFIPDHVSDDNSRPVSVDSDPEVAFHPGDLLWSKLGNYPFWPCMVIRDPTRGVYVRRVRTQSYPSLLYYVQYFGDDSEHGWTQARRFHAFEGLEKFKQFAEDTIAQATSAKTRAKLKAFYSLNVSATRKENWLQAVEDATNALTLSSEERLDKFSIVWKYAASVKNAAYIVNPDFERLEQILKDDPTRTVVKVDTAEFTKNNEELVKRLQMQPVTLPLAQSTQRRLSVSSRDSRKSVPTLPRRSATKTRASLPARKKESATKESVAKEVATDDEMKSTDDSESVTSIRHRSPSHDFDQRRALTNVIEHGNIKESVCCSCFSDTKGSEELLVCACGNHFHKSCHDSSALSGDTKSDCPKCVSEHCHICSQSSSTETPLLRSKCCPRWYHVSCLAQASLYFKLSANNSELLKCPRHCCLMCHSAFKNMEAPHKGPFIRCVQCPATYHRSRVCIPASCQFLTKDTVICPRHTKATVNKNRINVSWCFICSQGGTLICCESCPSAFHQRCLPESATAKSKFACPECSDWLFPTFERIVWVKLGAYKWWPARICHPADLPENISRLSHDASDFAVFFFGSHNYYWLNGTRAFHYCEGDSRKTVADSEKRKKVYDEALLEAEEAFGRWQEQIKKLNKHAKPPKFKMISTNKIISPSCSVKMKREVDDERLCQCTSASPCDDDKSCFNRIVQEECSADCLLGDKCKNNRLSKKLYKKNTPFLTNNGRGWGLRLDEPAKKGEFVIEYVGELIDEAEYERRINKQIIENDDNFYFLTVSSNRILDAGPAGNNARFINHSCEANLATQKWKVNGETRVGLFAHRDIAAGEELTFDYRFEARGSKSLICHCGTKSCSGFIASANPSVKQSSSDSSSVTSNGSTKIKKPPKKRSSSVSKVNNKQVSTSVSYGNENKYSSPPPLAVSTPPAKQKSPTSRTKLSVNKSNKQGKKTKLSTDCFSCSKPGGVLKCSQCVKYYHLSCVDRTSPPPRGNWYCPRHYCLVCGEPSISLCGLCTHAFCREHTKKKYICTDSTDGSLVCVKH